MDLHNCTLCPRNCHADRINGQTGYCGQTDQIRAARAALHMWEEPCISGQTGSGTVFFSGCNMGCIFCQNHTISQGMAGKEISVERLAQIFLELQNQHACNINLVTPTHFIPQIKKALEDAKAFAAEIATKEIQVAIKVGEGGRAFGSVSSKEISEAAKAQLGYTLDKKKILLPNPLKALGTTTVGIKLHPKVTAELKVIVKEA